MNFIGALDQGTTSTRFMIIDHSGHVVGQHQLEHQQILPAAGWVEHDANEIWQRTQEVISGAIASAGISSSQISAIGITNQRETTVAWDSETGKALHHAIVWQDIRTQDFLDQLGEDQKRQITHTTGLTIAPYFSASKMRWLLDNSSEVRSARDRGTLKFGTIDSWLMWNLTSGLHLTDVTNASRTMLMDLETLDWDLSLLETFGIPRSALAQIKSSAEIYGTTQADGVFGCEIPIAAMLGDQHAAMVGQLCFERGDSKTTYGTGNFALVNTGTTIARSHHGLLTTVCFKFGDQPAMYALEGSVAVTGSAIQWLRDQLGIISKSSEVELLASQVADNGGVYFVPAFSGLFAPHWRSDARGVIVGLTRAANKSHLARAALEAICYQTRDIIDAMAQETSVALATMRVDGGATENNLLMQIQADILGIDISRPVITETTALGAALAAGLAIGFWKDRSELAGIWSESGHWSPASDQTLRTSGYENWKKALTRTLNWVE